MFKTVSDKYPDLVPTLALLVDAVWFTAYTLLYHLGCKWLYHPKVVAHTIMILFIAAVGVWTVSMRERKALLTVAPITWIIGCFVQSTIVVLLKLP